MDSTLLKPHYKTIDFKIKAIINRANASNIKATDYESIGDSVAGTKTKLQAMDFKAWLNSVIAAVNHHHLFMFNYLNDDTRYDDLLLIFGVDDINVLLYIRDNDAKYIKLVASNLNLSMAGVYKLINRTQVKYVYKLESVLGYSQLAKVLK